jgi:hypothetical protein
MSRLIRFLFIFFLILVVLGAFLWTQRVSLLERYFTDQLNQEVSIEAVSIGRDSLDIKHWKMKSKTETNIPYILSIRNLKINMSPVAFFKNPVCIRSITIQDPTLVVELYNLSGSENNWTSLLKITPSPSENRQVHIDELSIFNLQFEIYKMNGRKIAVPAISSLQFENLGEKNSLAFEDIEKIVCEAMLLPLTKQPNLRNLLDGVPDFSKKELHCTASKISLNKIKKQFHATTVAIKQKALETKEFLQRLFSN